MTNNNGNGASLAASSANYIFRIHDDGASDMTLQGWERSSKLSSEKIKTIKDVLKKGAAKVATSVPSPFARMHLFDTAFRMVAEQPDGDSVYHQLVSDCMDMFQLIFNAGNSDPKIKFRVWNRQERINKLRESGPGHPHKLLADSLEMFFTGRFADVQQITLIYYEHLLIGGTSPLTLFFTSPNWQREMQENRIILSSAAGGDIFFDMDYCPLHKRDKVFVTFIYKYYLACKSLLHKNCDGFASYIRNTIERYAPDMAQKAGDEWKEYVDNPQMLDTAYQKIAIVPNSSTYLQTGNLYSYTVKTGDIAELIQNESDFLIQPTTDYFKGEKDTKTSERSRYKPLVLARRMNIAGTYTYGDIPWSADTDIRRASIMDTYGNPLPLAQRTLPGHANITYPFITTEDFLEDTLVRMPFRLNNDKFFTGSSGEFHYLLPVKKEYFNFFTLADLRRNLSIIHGENKVTVQLQIPVRNKKGTTSIIFSREYEVNKTPIINPVAGLAISPFYRITDADPQLQELNEYTILYAEDNKSEGAELSFWKYADIAARTKIAVPKPEARTLRSRSGSSYYYKVNTAFDLIELRMKDEQQITYSGLIIPEFKQVTNRQANKQFTFAIDFGTSNSHIAYIEDKRDKPKTFEITEDDMQTVSLNAPGEGNTAAERYTGGLGDFAELKTFINKEFLPLIIGKTSGAEVHFPIRTVTAEKATFTSETPSLFQNINCGFYLDSDETQQDNLKYQTNLKWLFENNQERADPDRIEAFLKELLLIIRNKVIMNGGRINNTQIVWLVPLSMKQRSIGLFTGKWEKAFKEVFKSSGAQLLEPITESVAPYFFLKKNSDANVLDFADAINVDIGGGTTDIMFFMRQTEQYMSTSFRFAGNDIWGDGFNRFEKNNGFIRHFQAHNKEKKQNKERADLILEKFMDDRNLTSEDVVSLLFRYDTHFGFSDSISRNCPQLKIILFLHYSAIIYHLIQLIEKEGLSLPRYFTFTGKGSQYLSLMCGKDMLTRFTKMLLGAYTSLPVPNDFKVVLADNPKEATANGATLFVNSEEKDRINREAINIVQHWGNEAGAEFSFRKDVTTAADILGNKDFQVSVLKNLQQFVEKTLRNESIAIFLAEYDIKQLQDYELFLTSGDATKGGPLFDSFYTLLNNTKAHDRDGISETYFFFPLKDALYTLSKHITEKKA